MLVVLSVDGMVAASAVLMVAAKGDPTVEYSAVQSDPPMVGSSAEATETLMVDPTAAYSVDLSVVLLVVLTAGRLADATAVV